MGYVSSAKSTKSFNDSKSNLTPRAGRLGCRREQSSASLSITYFAKRVVRPNPPSPVNSLLGSLTTKKSMVMKKIIITPGVVAIFLVLLFGCNEEFLDRHFRKREFFKCAGNRQ